jgi:hypothetical protein
MGRTGSVERGVAKGKRKRMVAHVVRLADNQFAEACAFVGEQPAICQVSRKRRARNGINFMPQRQADVRLSILDAIGSVNPQAPCANRN